MATRKKAEGIELLRPKIDPGSIQDITMLDWFVGFALMSMGNVESHEEAARQAYERAEEVMKERAVRTL